MYAWIKHTNTSKKLYPIDNSSIKLVLTDNLQILKQFATKANTICPALILAIKRTVSVNGRIKTLIVSMKIKNGLKIIGVPLGKKCPKNFFGFQVIPLRIK
jgi:hypothetical protein